MSSDSRRDCGQLGSDGGVPALHSKIIALPGTPVHTEHTRTLDLQSSADQVVVLCATHNSGAFLCAVNTMPASASLAAIGDNHSNSGGTHESPIRATQRSCRSRQAGRGHVAAAQAKNRAALQSQREKLKSWIDAATTRTQANATAANEEMQSWWDETRSNIHNRFEELRAKRDERHAERDLQRAENRADDAELDAAEGIDFAAYAIDEAEYAVVDAVIARADVDDLA